MIISPDRSGRIDPVVYNIIKHIKTDKVLVPITRLENFQFSEELLSLDDYILINFCEMGWDYEWNETPIFGINAHLFRDKFSGDEWSRFIDFTDHKKPILTLQRELLNEDSTETILPIEYPALNPIPPIETKDQYHNRPIEVFYNWGLSNPMRPKLQGDIWLGSNKYGYNVCDSFHHLVEFIKNENGRKWVSINTPYYARFPMESVLSVNGISKLSVSLFGSGKKCFRTTEASVNSLMVMPEDNFAHTYEWVDMSNCIKFTSNDFVEELNGYVNSDCLYDLYVEGVETCKKYFLPTYIKHLESTINGL